MVDLLRLRELLDRLRELLDRRRTTSSELQRLASLGAGAVRSNPDRLNSVKYLFVLAAGQCIDIGQHIISVEGLEAPTTFADVFVRLHDAGWVSEDLSNCLASLARFRNLLVHGYADVDDERVVHILASNLGDLGEYRQAIASRIAD